MGCFLSWQGDEEVPQVHVPAKKPEYVINGILAEVIRNPRGANPTFMELDNSCPTSESSDWNLSYFSRMWPEVLPSKAAS